MLSLPKYGESEYLAIVPVKKSIIVGLIRWLEQYNWNYASDEVLSFYHGNIQLFKMWGDKKRVT